MAESVCSSEWKGAFQIWNAAFGLQPLFRNKGGRPA